MVENRLNTTLASASPKRMATYPTTRKRNPRPKAEAMKKTLQD